MCETYMKMTDPWLDSPYVKNGAWGDNARNENLRVVDGDTSTPFYALEYESPKDPTDLEECKEVDEKNKKIHEHNVEVFDIINSVLRSVGKTPVSIYSPPQYADSWRTEVNNTLKDKFTALVKSIAYHRDVMGMDVYIILNDAIENPESLKSSANDHAFEIEIARRIAGAPITVRVGRKLDKWDGISERTQKGFEVKWERGKYHSFLAPSAVAKVTEPKPDPRPLPPHEDSRCTARQIDE